MDFRLRDIREVKVYGPRSKVNEYCKFELRVIVLVKRMNVRDITGLLRAQVGCPTKKAPTKGIHIMETVPTRYVIKCAKSHGLK